MSVPNTPNEPENDTDDIGPADSIIDNEEDEWEDDDFEDEDEDEEL